MKKLGLVCKEISENRIKNCLKSAEGVFIIKYSGLSSPDLTSLRLSLLSSRADMFVVKNSTARRAFKAAGLDGLIKAIEGPCGLIFTKDEPVDTSRALYNFSKDHEKLVLEAGLLKDKVLEKKDIEAMAKLPSLPVLRAQFVMTLNSPIRRLVVALKSPLNKVAICLEQIKKKKESTDTK